MKGCESRFSGLSRCGRRSIKAVLLFVLVVLSAGQISAGEASRLILQNTNVIDVLNGKRIENVDVLIAGKWITRIEPHNPDTQYADAHIIDGKGQYCIPGLIDSHVHLDTEPIESLPFLLRNGITTVRDMAGDAGYLREIIAEIESGHEPGPDIYFSALMAGRDYIQSSTKIKRATPTDMELGEAPWARQIDDKTDIAKVINDAKNCGACALKLYSDLTAVQIKQLTGEGHKQGLQVWAHAAVYPATCEQVIDAGVDCISHYALLLRPETFSGKWNPGLMVVDESIIRSGRLKKLLLRMKSQGTCLDPTLICCDKLIQLQTTGKGAEKAITLGYQSVRMAHEIGIPIVAGTDLPIRANDVPFLFHELEALVDRVGLTPGAALRCATLNGVVLLGVADTHGTIDAGKTADIVMLAKNPLQQIDNLRSITHVIKNGKVQF